MSDRVQLEPRTERVVVKYRDHVIADARRSVRLRETGYPERIYIPKVALRPEVKVVARKGASCPWKGDWQWIDAVVDGRDLSHMIWEYHEPNEHCSAIKNHIAVDPKFLTVEVDGEPFA